jgi:cyclic dehypoxanthinyl futalosine synthase
MAVTRLGAVDYLNARPLVFGLELRSDLFRVRFDVPSKCAALLHEGSIDVGMIPSIEYQRGTRAYRIVRGMGIISDGAVGSVAIFASRPIEQLRSIAVDTSSRTSAGLTSILCREVFGIVPDFVPMPPSIDQMLARCDAALVIGDPALYLDYAARGLSKVDLGEVWLRLTGLPFVWAFWSGRRRCGIRQHRRFLLRARAVRARTRVFEGEYPVYARRAGRGRPSQVLPARVDPRPHRRRALACVLPMTVDRLAAKVRAGERIDPAEALELYKHAPTALLGRLADDVRARKHPERIVTYIIDRNVNYTNVCVARCNFCAFYRPVGSSEGYVLGFEEIFRKIDETIALGGGQLLLQGGHNPDLPLEWYEDLFRAVKEGYPSFRLHALSPPEVIHLSRLSRLPVPQVIDRLIAAGLDSIPGGGAEILVDRVRRLLNCYGKATADEWLAVMRHAHRKGLRTTATMMYGTVETMEERLEHLLRLRAVQDETAGFTAFITWSYQPEHTELGGGEATGVDRAIGAR